MVIKKTNEDFYPFDDENQYRFYRDLPDLARFVVESTNLSPSNSTHQTSSSDSEIEDIYKKSSKS